MKSAAEIARTSLGPSHNAQDVFTVAQMILDHAREMRAG